MKKAFAVSSIALTSLALAACGGATGLKDGAYTQHQTYNAGDDKNGHYTFYIDVNATLAGDKLTAISVAPDPNGQAAVKYVESFKKDVEQNMIGKTLTEAKKLGYISGASLTSKAFADALDAIEQQATPAK